MELTNREITFYDTMKRLKKEMVKLQIDDVVRFRAEQMTKMCC